MRIGIYDFGANGLPLVLAPMAAVSDLPFRRIAFELGASLAPTELISAEGLWRAQKRTLAYLRHDPALERPFCVQIFGARPETMAKAALAAVEHGAGIIDINMGCPVSKVVSGGAGAALMRDPERAVAIVRALRAALPEAVPVTAKFRSGWDASSLNAVEFAQRLEGAGVAAIAVHGRTRAQAYSGKADWSAIAAVKRAVSIPVIGNGDVLCQDDARRMVEQTRCDAVMIGRGAMGNPWIFRECRGGASATRAERGPMVRRHLLEHLEWFGRERVQGIHAFRTQLACYAKGLHGAAEFRRDVMRIDELDSLLAAIEGFFSE
jgi:nifR3 family TIM-barrel protein